MKIIEFEDQRLIRNKPSQTEVKKMVTNVKIRSIRIKTPKRKGRVADRLGVDEIY